MSEQGRQRGNMPLCAAFIDDFRDAFGAADINQQVARGMRGEPVFWASENGVELGTKPEPGVEILPEIALPITVKQARR